MTKGQAALIERVESRIEKALAHGVSDTPIAPIELRRLIAELTRLQEEVDRQAQNAAFFRSCALGGEVPTEGSEPHPKEKK